jgi:predicted ATPase
VPKATIVNWLAGRVERPRRWHDLMAVAAALRLDLTDTEQLLRVAGHPSLANLRQQAHSCEEQALLAAWPIAEVLSEPSPTLARRELPASLNRLIGRSEAITAVRALVTRPDVRMVTLTGPGGVGKTRLALQVATDLQASFADGVVLVHLDAISDPMLVGAALAQAMGLTLLVDSPQLPQLVAALGGRQLLLVLDGCEQVAGDISLVSRLLAALPRLRLLATSRIALRLAGSYAFCVPPLELPPPTCARTAVALAEVPAVELFVERARAIRHDFVFDDQHAPAIAAICERLDGVPLALELAASRMASCSPAELLNCLERGSILCATGNTDLPARQTSVQANLNWSYDLLAAHAQITLARLAVFGGSFTLAAAEAVATDQARSVGAATTCGSENTMRETLTLLVEHSLLQHRVESSGGRFSQLEVTRVYGQRLLAAGGELNEARRRHAAYFQALALQQRPHLLGPTQAATLLHLEAERANLRTALAWLIEHDPEAAAQMAFALYYFWAIRGHMAEGQQLLKQLLVRLPHPTSGRMLALDVAGSLAYKCGSYCTAQAYHQEHLALRQQANDSTGTACAWNMLGQLALRANDLGLAYSYCEAALRRRRLCDDPHAIALSLDGLGQVLAVDGAIEKARALYAESMQLKHQVHDLHGMAVTLRLQGNLARQRGDKREALLLYEQGLMLARTVQALESEALILRELGHLTRETGNQAQAAVYLTESRLRFQRMVHGGDCNHCR